MARCTAPSSRPWATKERRARLRREVAVRDGTLCHWCRRPLNLDADGTVIDGDPEAMATLDHVVGRRRCTPDMVVDPDNIVLACPRCNNERDGKRATSTEFVELTAEEMAWVNDPPP